MDRRFHPFERAIEDWHWWYRVRRDILDQVLARVPLDRDRALILDVGCGTGGSSLALSRHGRVVGLDAAMQSFRISMDRPYTHRAVGRAESLPFREEAFDVVAALDVLEHLDDDVAGAREVRRVLKPGGRAVVFVPAFNALWRKNDDFSHHRRRYTRPLLERTLDAAGFTVEDSGYFNMLLLPAQVAGTIAERLFPRAVASFEYSERPSLANRLLERTFRLELPLLRRRGLPLGTSVFCLARRD